MKLKGIRCSLSLATFALSRAEPRWHARDDIVAATGTSDDQWGTAITYLVARGDAERQGERRGVRYKANLGEEKI